MLGGKANEFLYSRWYKCTSFKFELVIISVDNFEPSKTFYKIR